jgi:drug/metabolite transporter (DMT)-like permease
LSATEIAAAERSEGKRRRGVWLAVAAVIFFATSPVFVLGAAPLSSPEITVGRLGSGALLVWCLALANGQPLFPHRRDLPLFLAFGLITALHFLAYITSLSFTTIAHSLAIVYTAPIFVALFSAWWLHEPLTRRKWAGVGVTVLGIGILAGFEARWTSRMAIGDGMALVSAVMFAFYSVGGRSQRRAYPLFTYAGTVYGLAALWMLPAAVFTFTPAGYQVKPLLMMLAAGLIPLGMGHTLYNAALRRSQATTVNLVATQEVTGGVLLGVLFLHQIPAGNEIIGAAIALLGIVIVLL